MRNGCIAVTSREMPKYSISASPMPQHGSPCCSSKSGVAGRIDLVLARKAGLVAPRGKGLGDQYQKLRMLDHAYSSGSHLFAYKLGD